MSQWQPSATLHHLQQRSQLIQSIRDFFKNRGYLEVETPCLGHFGVTDRYLENIEASFRGQQYALQTSPEYHMKRLLAAYKVPIFQLARVFRDDELGRLHNPEFTLLEWYQLQINHVQLLEEVDALLQHILKTPPLTRSTYQEIFQKFLGVNPFTDAVEALQLLLEEHHLNGVLDEGEQDRDQYLFLLMSHVIEPHLAKEEMPYAIIDFPASQASLAQVVDGKAARFEVYYKGMELANGFHELTDANMQRERFLLDNQLRVGNGLQEKALDSFLLSALEAGLPPCAGVALGVDRFLALALGLPSIEQTLTFGFERA